MHSTLNKVLTSSSPDDTDQIAARLASSTKPPATILLSGEIGAGKSAFARSFIRASGVTERDIPSPTFTLVQTYQGERATIWHCDLYRLSDVSEVEELGLFEAFEDAICLVEWPDRLGSERPADALEIEIAAGQTDQERTLTLKSRDARWQEIIQT